MPQSRIRRYLKHGTFPQLSVFEAVARLGSFTRAAEELYLAQPTVSVQMRKLAETLGVPLVEQVGKKMHLTEAGRRVQTGCERVFATLAELEDSLTDLQGLRSGRLRLGVASAAASFAARMVTAFSREAPGIEISLHVHNRAELLEAMARDRDDLCLLATPPDCAEFTVEFLLSNPLIAVASASHPLARARRIPFARLAEEDFLMREPGSGTRAVVQALFDRHALIPRVRMELAGDLAIREAVAAGAGVAVVPRDTYGAQLASCRPAVLDVEDFPIAHKWYLVHLAHNALPPPAARFIEFARAAIASAQRV